MHILVHHVWEYVRDFGELNLWTMEGSEKLNDLMTTYYFRSTNRSIEKKISQLLQKRNRIEHHLLNNRQEKQSELSDEE